MRGLARFFLGVLFIGFLPLFLVTHAVKTTFLDTTFWSSSIRASGVYQEMSSGIVKLQESVRVAANPPSEDRLRDIVEGNVGHILDYLKGNSESITLKVSLTDLNFPSALMRMPQLAALSQPVDVLTLVPQLVPDPAQQKMILDTLKTVQIIGSHTPLLWTVFLAGSIIALIGFFLLGDSLRSKVQGTAMIVLIAGLASLTAAMGAKSVLGGLLVNFQGLPPWVGKALTALVEGFFVPGTIGGAAASVLGLAGVLGGLSLPQAKIAQKTKPASAGPMKLIVLAGGLVGLVAIALLVWLGVKSGAIKMTASISKNGSQSGVASQKEPDAGLARVQKLIDEPYDSGFGWSVRYPQGWGVNRVEQVKAVGFNRKVDPNNPAERGRGALLAIQPQKRTREVDSGDAPGILGDLIRTSQISGAPNSAVAMEPVQDTWNGLIRIRSVFDYDSKDGGRIRQMRWYVYPKKGGDGYMLYTQSMSDYSDLYQSLFEQALATFTLTP